MPASPADSEAEQTVPPAGTVEEGDAQPTGPRKQPTLYGPDESSRRKSRSRIVARKSQPGSYRPRLADLRKEST